jgi:bisphosphoglycerate-dependent phosphoglycerate mutase
LILKQLHTASTSVFEDAALNERDYGELTGLTRTVAVSR